MKTVVCGLAIRDGKILMALRRKDDRRPNVWELPGGKVEHPESERDALRREWRGELGVDIVAGPIISTVSLTFEHRMHLILYACLISEGTPKPLASQAVGWFNPEDVIALLPIVPSHAFFHGDILAYLAEQSW